MSVEWDSFVSRRGRQAAKVMRLYTPSVGEHLLGGDSDHRVLILREHLDCLPIQVLLREESAAHAMVGACDDGFGAASAARPFLHHLFGAWLPALAALPGKV